MTAVMVTCQKGHPNPRNQHFCGECGAPLAVNGQDPSSAANPTHKLGAPSPLGVTPDRTYPYYYPPRPTRYPPPPTRRSTKTAWIMVAILAVVGVIGLAIFGVMMLRPVKYHLDPSSGGPAKTKVVPSTQDQWFAAVCKPGTFFDGGGNGQWLTDSVGRGSCSSSVTRDWIYIGQYSSKYLAQNDAAMSSGLSHGSSAIVQDTNGYMLFVAPTDRTGASLQPLAQFGFTITPAQG